MVTLSIIIINWNTKDLLKNCLESISEYTSNLDYEILVVDNASSDDSVEMIEKEFPQVRLIKNEEDFGFARANNQAIKESKGRYILLLNPDTQILNNGALEKMIGFMENNKKVGILGPKTVAKDGSLQISCYRFDSLSTLLSTNVFFNKLGKGNTYKKFDFNQTKKVDMIMGGCLLTKREVIEDIGLLDENFFLCSEDADWCLRAKKKGWEVVYYPTVEIIHIGAANYEKMSKEEREEFDREAYKSRIKFFKKHFSKVEAKVMSALLFIGALLRLIILFFLIYFNLKPTPENKKRLHRYWAVFKWYLLKDER
jgi:hypothetical protein